MTELDPIDPTVINPGLVAIPLAPTVWDDAEDGQRAVTAEGLVFQRRGGLWHLDPWWQGEGSEQIKAVCADPDEWAYDLGWTRAHVEDAHGSLTPITLPNDGYPHSDDRCRQDSVDAEGFRDACRGIAAIAEAEGVDEWSGGLTELVQHMLDQRETP